MRIRKPFAGAFAGLLLGAGYLGLAPITIPSYSHSDKGLHFLCFFLLTFTFYWIVENSRRRVLQLTLLVCTSGLGLGSELLQGILPNGRDFDYLDIVANILGSVAALSGCAWYHRRMLERKRAERYHNINSDVESGVGDDVELANAMGSQETGVTDDGAPAINDELDNWDETAEDDWDQHDSHGSNGVADAPSKGAS